MQARARTLTGMWRGACRRMFFEKYGGTLGLVKGSSMTICYDHMVRAESMEFKMDVWHDLHLTKSRFPVLQKTYLNIDEFDAFLVRCSNAAKERGAVTKLHANPHKPRGINRTKKTGNYAHGGCIHGWGFRLDKSTKTPVLSMHSRVSYLPYMGGLDLALSYHIARTVGAELGYTVEDFSFVWYCDSFQFAHMQSVAYCQNDEEFMYAIDHPKKYPDSEYPTIKLMRATIWSFREKMENGFKPEEEKFAQLMRYRRRWEARVSGKAKSNGWYSIPVDKLNLNALQNTRVRLPTDDEEIELVERQLA